MRQAGKTVLKWMVITILIGVFGSNGFTQEAITIPKPSPVSNEMTTSPPMVTSTPQRTYSLDQLKADFEQLKQEIITNNPMRYTDRLELTRVFESQARQIKDGMHEWEFYRVLTPIVAKVNCSHTYLQPSKEYENYLVNEGKFLPFEIKVIHGRAYVCQNLSSVAVPVGAEVVSINGKAIPEIIALFLNNLTADGKNLTRKYYMINRNFSLYFHRFIDPSDEFAFEYIDPQAGQLRQVPIAALTRASQLEIAHQNSIPTASVEKALYSQQFQANYGLLSIKSFAFYQNHSQLRFFIDRFFNEVATKHVPNVIIDLRGNSGGNPLCAAHLFSYLISSPTPYFAKDTANYELTLPILPAKNLFKGKAWILADGGSFGATGHLISLLKYHKIGILIGEETGGTYAYTDVPNYLVLNNTQLRLYSATLEFKTAVSGFTLGRGILPDVEVTPALTDYLSGRDLVKDYAVWSIENIGKK